VANRVEVVVRKVDSEDVERDGADAYLAGVGGLLIPGGFGRRGIEGKIAAVRYVRERGIPFFGICLGMQVAVLEFARHVAGLPKANSTEFDPETVEPVIGLMEEQMSLEDMGGTMRLGAFPCTLAPGTLAHVEIAELPDHPWFLGVQFHPEFKSKPLRSHPLFRNFVRAAVMQGNRKSHVSTEHPIERDVT
jgi:CTP synthase